jgi:hypothetical protein
MDLAIPRPTSHVDIDPYAPAIGAVPHNVQTQKRPLKRKLTAIEEQERAALELQSRMRVELYHRFLDAIADVQGNKVLALAAVFNITVDEVRANYDDLLAEVYAGRASSSVTKLLERADLDLAARITVLRKHVYSDTPAASLKALDMIDQMAGARSERGSFENFLLLVKSQGEVSRGT